MKTDTSKISRQSLSLHPRGRRLLSHLAVVFALTLGSAFAQYTTVAIPGGVRITGYTGTPPANLVIPNTIGGQNVLEIGPSAFEGNTSIVSLSFPSTLTTIGSRAFRNCDLLGAVSIPSNVLTIGSEAFARCNSLLSIAVSAANPNYTSRISPSIPYYTRYDGVLFSKDNTQLLQYPSGRSDASFTVPSTVTSISDEAFAETAALHAIVFPASLTSLGSSSLADCDQLATAAFLGNAPGSFGTGVFSGAAADFEIRYVDGTTGFSSPTWEPTAGQVYNTLQAGIENGFLYHVTAGAPPTNNAEIEILAYLGLNPLSTITEDIFVNQEENINNLSESTPIGKIVFAVDTGDYFQKAFNPGSNDFDWFKINFEIPDYIQGMPVTSIADYAFVGNSLILAPALPSTLRHVGQKAFYDCRNIYSILLPAGVSAIEDQALGSCDTMAGTNKFYVGGYNLIPLPAPGIVVHPGNLSFRSQDGVLYNKNTTALIQYPLDKSVETYTLPSTVTEIAPYAFSESNNLVTIGLPNNVARIGAYAFWGGESLVSVTFGTGLTNIGNGAFADCPALTSATFLGNAPTTFGQQVFYRTSPGFVCYYNASSAGFTTPTWEPTIGQIYNAQPIGISSDFLFTVAGGQATVTGYAGTSTSITIPSTLGGVPVRKIAESAFEGQSALVSVELPASLTEIGARAFHGTQLATITIPGGVVTIGELAFGGNALLKNVTVVSSNGSYMSQGGVLYNKARTRLILFPPALVPENINFSIPSTVTEIVGHAFENNSTLPVIEIPNGVRTIGERAFYNTQILTEVRIGSGVNTIGNEAFAMPVSALVQAVFYGDSPTTLGLNIFSGTPDSFEVRYLPGKTGFPAVSPGSWEGYAARAIDSINNFTFEVVSNTVRITGYSGVPDSISKFITTLPAPNQIVQFEYQLGDPFVVSPLRPLGWRVFVLETNLLWQKTGTDPILFTAIDTSNKRLELGATLGSVVMEQVVSEGIVERVFYQKIAEPSSEPNSWIEVNFQIPETLVGLPVTAIADGAFEGNEDLSSVALPGSLNEIGSRAFAGCSNLAPAVFLPSALETIGDGAFADCERLTTFYGNPLNASFTVDGGILYNKSRTKIVAFPAGRQVSAFEIPTTVTEIAASAFEGSLNLVSVRFPSAVAKVGNNAFLNCPTLVEAYFEGNAPATIGENIFVGAAQSFRVVYFLGKTGFTPQPWPNNPVYALNEINSFGGLSIGVLGGNSVVITGLATPSESVTIPNQIGGFPVVGIADGAFEGESALKSVTLPSSLVSIGARAFAESGIETITIPAGVSTIGDQAFFNCRSLTSITVDPANAAFDSKDGVLFTQGLLALLQYPTGLLLPEYTLPTAVTRVANRAFYGNPALVRIKLSNSIASLGDEAMAQLPVLNLVEFPGRAPSTVGANVFAGAAPGFSIAYMFGTGGFSPQPWAGNPDYTLTPVLLPGAISTYAPNGFQAIGTLAPSTLTGGLGGSIALTANRNGLVSGTLNMGATSARFMGNLVAQTGQIIGFAIINRTQMPVLVDLKLGGEEFNGLVSLSLTGNATVGQMTSTVEAFVIPWTTARPSTAYSGYYTVALETNQQNLDWVQGDKPVVSQGQAFFGLTIDKTKGTARIAGTLADGTAFTASSSISGIGQIPVWTGLYSKGGSLTGDLLVDISQATRPISGSALWNKPPGVKNSPDSTGFSDVPLTVAAASGLYNFSLVSFIAPRTLSFNQGLWSVNSSGLVGGNFNVSYLFAGNGLVFFAPNPNAVAGKLNSKTGRMDGTFINPNTGTARRCGKFQGMYLTGSAVPAFRGSFIMPNTPTKPTFYLGGLVNDN